MPGSLEELDLLLLTVARARTIHPDGIHFQSLRYLDPVLAAYVGESVIIRYDPRDMAEIRIFYRDRFLCRAICPDLANRTISLKEITAARNARRRELRTRLGQRASVVDRLIEVHAHPHPSPHRNPVQLRTPRRRSGSSATGRSDRMDQDTHDEAAAQETEGGSSTAGPRPPAGEQLFITTKQHRRFTEFADAVRLDRYIGLCYGPPGVGKTLSARRYACWHELVPMLRQSQKHFTGGSDRSDWHTIIYTPPVSASPRMIDKELCDLGSRLAMIRTPGPFDDRIRTDDAHSSPRFVELLIVDEADRLKPPALEQLRDHYDRSHLGMILIGMPGIEKTLARYPQLYSRIGFVHEYRSLSAEELTFVLQRHWSAIGLTLSADYFTDAEALAAVHRITSGNFRLVHRLFAQITRVLEINGLRTISREVVETARESLVIGTL